MSRYILSFCTGLFLHTASVAQSKLYFGADVAYVSDHYKITDPAGYITKPQLDGALFGVHLRLMVDKYSYIETGFYGRGHRQGIGFSNGWSSSGTGPNSILIPLRFGLSIPVAKEKFRVGAVAGYTVGIRNNNESLGADGQFENPGGDKINFIYVNDYPARVYSLIQTGITIDIWLFQKAYIRLNGSHYAGLQDLLVQDIRYSVNDGPDQLARSHYKGSFFSFGIGISYPVGDAAIKKYK